MADIGLGLDYNPLNENFARTAFRKNMANEQLQQYRRSTQDARRVAAQQLSGLTTALPQAMAGWNENFLTQLNTSALATGAVQQAAGHLGAIQEAVSLGGVKDLATLLGE